MSTFYAYHVVTEHPMYIGQHIIFDESHHSGVYQRVMDKLHIVNDIYSHPEQYQDVNLEYPVVVALRELALEEVRKEKYPLYPSRLGCLYVSETLQEAIQWADYFVSLGRTTYHIVKFKISGNVFIGDATKCFDATIDKASNLVMAEKYWKNETNSLDRPPIKEILASGDLEVIEIVKEIE